MNYGSHDAHVDPNGGSVVRARMANNDPRRFCRGYRYVLANGGWTCDCTATGHGTGHPHYVASHEPGSGPTIDVSADGGITWRPLGETPRDQAAHDRAVAAFASLREALG